MKKIRLLLAACAVSAALVLPAITYAENGEEGTNHSTSSGNSSERAKIEAERLKKKAEAEKQIADKRAEFEKKRQETKNKVEVNRDDAKLKICEKRIENLKKRAQGVYDRGERRIEVFNKIAERVQAFSKEKNLTVPNYDQLAADISVKGEALRQAHELVKENARMFQCGEDGAKADAAIFKEAIANEHQAFKEYKESIKNLIKAVKQAIEANKPGENNAQ